MLSVMFVTGLSEYFFIGPQYPWSSTPGGFEPNCRDEWYYNLLYINNFRPQNKQVIFANLMIF